MTQTTHLALLIVSGALLIGGCTEPEKAKAPPPPGMAGAPAKVAKTTTPSTLGNHGNVAAASQPADATHRGAKKMPATQPGTQPGNAPSFPSIIPGSGSPAGTGHKEPTHTGVIVEAMDAADYTYMRIKKDNGKEEWAATTRTSVKVGDRITISESLVMHDFKSKTLNKTFPRIIFGSRE